LIRGFSISCARVCFAPIGRLIPTRCKTIAGKFKKAEPSPVETVLADLQEKYFNLEIIVTNLTEENVVLKRKSEECQDTINMLNDQAPSVPVSVLFFFIARGT